MATKGGITALTKALAVDEAALRGAGQLGLAGQHLHPVVARSDRRLAIRQHTRADGDAAQLLGRMGTIEDPGRLCLFLAAEATFTTGVDHIISGGAELSYGRKTRRR